MSDSLNNVLKSDTINNLENKIQTPEPVNATESNTVPPLFGLCPAEIEALLSYESSFEEIPIDLNPIIPKTVSVSNCTSVTDKENSPVSNTISNEQLAIARSQQLPAPVVSTTSSTSNVQLALNNQPWWNTMNLCPNISNCVVNFNINNK